MNIGNFFRRTRLRRTKEHLQTFAFDIGMLFNDFWHARIIIWLKYFHMISPNYTNEENLQTRFSFLKFLKIHANISDMREQFSDFSLNCF